MDGAGAGPNNADNTMFSYRSIQSAICEECKFYLASMHATCMLLVDGRCVVSVHLRRKLLRDSYHLVLAS